MKPYTQLAILAAILSTSIAQAVDDPAWPTHQGNAAHTGFIDRDLVLGATAIHWQADLQPQPVTGLAVGAGRVYVTGTAASNGDQALIALSIDAGQELWRKTFPGVFSVNPPAYDPVTSTVFLQTGNHGSDTFLRAYDAVTGSFRWRSNFSAQWERYLAPTVIDGVVYINGGYYGGAYAFNVASGLEAWYVGLPQYEAWTPTVFGTDKLVSYTSRISVHDRATGTVLYAIDDPAYSWNGYTVGQTPAILGDFAYVTNGGSLVAYDLASRTVAWKLPINASGQISNDGNELFVVNAGTVSARKAVDGSLRWAVEPPAGGFRSQVLIFRNHLLVSDGYATYLISRHTHEIDRFWPVGGLLAYGDGHLFVGESSGRVTAIELASTPLFQDGFE